VRLAFHPATASRWADVERLFGERGACAGCWCMYWRLRAGEWSRGKGEKNRRAFRALVASGAEPGIIACEDGKPIGWCAVAPREATPRLEKSRVLARVDASPVWSITCLFVERSRRRRGVSALLLEAAAEHARARGAKIVEGYPVKAESDLPAPFVWTGLASAFRRAGFREVARRSPTRPIMRREL
jgi:GNAT superfamily N-acetyltransferase